MEINLLSRSGDLFLTGPIKKFLDIVLIGSYESGWYISNWSIMHMISGIIMGNYLKLYKELKSEEENLKIKIIAKCKKFSCAGGAF